MSYRLDISDRLDRIFSKISKKDKFQFERISKRIKQILENPHIGKSLRSRLAGKRRVHVRPFVLTYEILENEGIVRLLDYDHHDNIYR